MVSLRSAGTRFLQTPFDVIEGGNGVIHGNLSPTSQQEQPSFIFVTPRHVLRTAYPTPVRAGLVIRARSGEVYIVGENGPAEHASDVLWTSWRLFQATGHYVLQRRIKVLDPIAKVERDTGLQPAGTIWAAIESLDREQSDREMRVSFEQWRVVAGAEILEGDVLDNHTVTKVDKQLGISVGVLT